MNYIPLNFEIRFDVRCNWQWLVYSEQLDSGECLSICVKGGLARRRLLSVGPNVSGLPNDYP